MHGRWESGGEQVSNESHGRRVIGRLWRLTTNIDNIQVDEYKQDLRISWPSSTYVTQHHEMSHLGKF
jgi:hypothetical protein